MNTKYNALCLVVILLTMTVLGIGQARERIIQDKTFRNQPVKVVGKLINDRYFKQGEKIEAEPTWLRDFSFEIQNTSHKNIAAIYCMLEVEKQDNMALPLGIPINYIAKDKAGMVAPGGTLIIKIPSDVYANISKILENDAAHDIRKTILSVRQVYFDDKTRWVEGFEGPQAKKSRTARGFARLGVFSPPQPPASRPYYRARLLHLAGLIQDMFYDDCCI